VEAIRVFAVLSVALSLLEILINSYIVETMYIWSLQLVG
jgi:hypothetical protein